MTPLDPPKLTQINAQGRTKVEPRASLTVRYLEALKPEGRRYHLRDSVVRGLTATVYPSGKISFFLYRKLKGKPERIFIGAYPDIHPSKAREMAERLNAEIASGLNPGDERRRVKDEWTLEQLFSKFIEDYAKLHKRTWADDILSFNRHLHGWRLRKLSSIAKADVAKLHLHIGRTAGQYAANRIVELISSIFSRAAEWGWSGDNPAKGVKPFREEKRDRFLRPDELPKLFEALANEPNESIRDFVLLALMTGARRGNVQAMRWEEIDWANATWRIPETKNGQPQNVVLSPAAIRILEQRKQGQSAWVFPGPGKSGHLEEPKRAWKALCKRAELENLRLHDLRRTLGSWCAARGTSLPIIGAALGHRSLAATQIYSRLSLDPVRVAVNGAVDSMLLAAGKK